MPSAVPTNAPNAPNARLGRRLHRGEVFGRDGVKARKRSGGGGEGHVTAILLNASSRLRATRALSTVATRPLPRRVV
eukprot:CAMPEP_0206130340 /NCGR_PEP_ID=MMETSP1472-20131121/40425_1 /ASSEMBLY_ACC=CAM_ASM_001108 /TAXON_ID=41880 /ORGANISM="Pycnococcus provasolii, Strain RCC251" /LENGTH=76 /DNA_ID=CAMNT_0053521671 /DNA_START=280 /DNA_END=510 /DNA_ORIENTATION=-